MGLRVVAEGVESAGAIAMLDRLGCDIVQGYHISRPLPARDFEYWLAHSPWNGETPGDDLDPDLVLAT
jgi:EAL domain-containing protein (putative c-di-GMP-specific phosphodiesterase class I)